MKALIIGAAGFVGGHLINHLYTINGIEIFATKLENEEINNKYINNENIVNLDICNAEQVKAVIASIRPDYIFHLAAQSSVSLSWKQPALTYSINVIGTINILEAVKDNSLPARILIIGSAEEYGKVGEEDLPITEDTHVKPTNPYAVSKVSQEEIAKLYIQAYKLDIIMVRAFNHIGPGQSHAFVISDFAKQIAEIEKGLRKPVIYAGNLDVKRDFTDVRDIVRGYAGLIEKGKSGEIYNIGSGKSYSIRDLLLKMINISGRDIKVKVDPMKFRPIDIPELLASIEKIKMQIQWSPQIHIDASLEDILEFWRSKC